MILANPASGGVDAGAGGSIYWSLVALEFFKGEEVEFFHLLLLQRNTIAIKVSP